jgi:hypothetical protein
MEVLHTASHFYRAADHVSLLAKQSACVEIFRSNAGAEIVSEVATMPNRSVIIPTYGMAHDQQAIA